MYCLDTRVSAEASRVISKLNTPGFAEDVADATAFVADTAAGTVKAAADKVDSETDQLQSEEQDSE